MASTDPGVAAGAQVAGDRDGGSTPVAVERGGGGAPVAVERGGGGAPVAVERGGDGTPVAVERGGGGAPVAVERGGGGAPAAPAGFADQPPREPGDGVLARVRAQLPDLTGALLRVAEQVLVDPPAAARATIVELAERSGTSPATVTRFCRALGFEGYSDLRIGIAGETGRAARAAGWSVDIGREIQPDDPLDRVLSHIMAADTRAMHDTVALLDLAQVAAAADAIAAAARTDIYGASGSALVGAELQLSLHRIGVPAWAWGDVHSGLASAAVLAAGDVALGISHSGQNRETTEMLAEAGSRGATTVALTSFPRSPLAEAADLVLATAPISAASLAARDRSGATPPHRHFRPDALSARHPQLVVLDLLYIAVAQRTYERAHAAFQRTARAVDGHRAEVHT